MHMILSAGLVKRQWSVYRKTYATSHKYNLNTVCQKQKLPWLWWMTGNMTGLLIWSSCHGNADKGFSRESSRLGADGRITSSYEEELKGSCKRVREVLSAISAWWRQQKCYTSLLINIWVLPDKDLLRRFLETVNEAFCLMRRNHCFVSRNIRP